MTDKYKHQRYKPKKNSKLLEDKVSDDSLPINEWGRFNENDPPYSSWGNGNDYKSYTGPVLDEFGHAIHDY